MNTPDPAGPDLALARSVGLAAFVYGYPLLEMMRTCRLQTRERADTAAARVPVDRPWHWAGPTQAGDRDVVTPANDLMYTSAWIHLADGPRALRVPAAQDHPGRYFVLALYDAFTENFCNLGLRNTHPAGETVWLLGPGQAGPPPGAVSARVVRCPSTLVWLLARVLVVDDADLDAARRLQAAIDVRAPPASDTGRRPSCVERWQGPVLDPIAACQQQGEAAEPVAERFFGNLCRALADEPGPAADQALRAWFGQAGLRPGDGLDWQGLGPARRQGLVQGLQEGVALVAARARHRQRKPWVMSARNGRYGDEHLLRAIVAYIGLGALAPDEALYASGHFDAGGQPLDGRTSYTLRFAPGDTPPAAAFWSVTLYGADRYLHPNPLQRHAIGDRTRGLQRDADGGLTLHIAHEAPPDPGNWLPAPAGPFYLVLRLYHPQGQARGWPVPPLVANPASSSA